MKKEHQIPDWLKNLQENSWELELLISGGAIFTLFQASDFFLQKVNYIQLTMGLDMNPAIVVSIMGIKLLTFGFILHLMLRAFWVALVFINFVYPQGVNGKKIQWKKPFRANIDDKGDLYKPIMKIDRLSAIVMYMSIVFSIAIFGVMLLFICYTLLDTSEIVSGIITKFFLISIFIYLFDLLSFGLLKKIPYLSYILFPVFKLLDFISLRFIYQRSLIVYSSNVKRLHAVLFVSVFFVITILSTHDAVRKKMHWSSWYNNREYMQQLSSNNDVLTNTFYGDNKPFSFVTIPSEIIKSNFLKVKVKYWHFHDKYLDLIDKPQNERFLSDIIQVSIDDSIYADTKWHPLYDHDLKYAAIIAMIPIADLQNGEHLLKVEYTPQIMHKANEQGYNNGDFEILFWKDK